MKNGMIESTCTDEKAQRASEKVKNEVEWGYEQKSIPNGLDR